MLVGGLVLILRVVLGSIALAPACAFVYLFVRCFYLSFKERPKRKEIPLYISEELRSADSWCGISFVVALPCTAFGLCLLFA